LLGEHITGADDHAPVGGGENGMALRVGWELGIRVGHACKVPELSPGVEAQSSCQVGGMPDHVRILLSLPATLSIAKALQLIKGGSPKWVHETFPNDRLFGWQVSPIRTPPVAPQHPHSFPHRCNTLRGRQTRATPPSL